MVKLNLTRDQVKELFLKGEPIKKCSGLWNNPQTKGQTIKSIADIDSIYNWACKIEIKKFDNDNTIYIHGYSDCDMF